ncbi:hypothetical protein M4951_18435 [Blastopirellula sp. J2-11]|uniref:hypothetical protein n=1 Tax=Blastopirellula sp. J2-11 TaxID=2943192 RepID=UPI0021C9CEE7|nr:hypothetical protein [Blastopirellula sp. J2-11]UUO05347.1 hypothetical protein M4951_18435 [Blastopirellula sp. J2-11]
MKFFRVLKMSLFVCGLLALAPASQAQDAQVVANAKKYLDSPHNAKQILMLTHLGADLRSFSYVMQANIIDQQGQKMPERFALVYDYDWQWNGAGETRLAFLYNEHGSIYGIRVLATNGRANAPFELSSTSIKLVGGLFVEAMRSSASPEEIRRLETAVRSADTKALLTNSIMIGQAAGIRL